MALKRECQRANTYQAQLAKRACSIVATSREQRVLNHASMISMRSCMVTFGQMRMTMAPGRACAARGPRGRAGCVGARLGHGSSCTPQTRYDKHHQAERSEMTNVNGNAHRTNHRRTKATQHLTMVLEIVLEMVPKNKLKKSP